MRKFNSDVTLDTKGLACPMPIVQTKKMLEKLKNGEILEVLATDPGSGPDLKAWSESAHHDFLGTIEEGHLFKHYIKKQVRDVGRSIVVKQLTTEELLEKLQKDNSLTVIDVREPEEYQFEHIVFTINIPLGELKEGVEQFNKNETMYLICRSGNRSYLAAEQLIKLGFMNVYNVQKGMLGWRGETIRLIRKGNHVSGSK